VRSLAGLIGDPRRLGPAARAAARLGPSPVLERHLDWVTAGRRHERRGLYGPRLAAVDRDRVRAELAARAGELDGMPTARWLMNLDQVDYLADDVLVKTDRAGMLMSLEIRTIYLHRELAELAASIDVPLHLGRGGKALLRRMLPQDIPSSESLGRYRKTAFRVPAADWLRGPLAPVMERQLQRGTIYGEGYFERDAVRRLVQEHRAGGHDHSEQLWPLLSLGLWADRFFGLDGA
jgi:asparagine synthase (glutamine-hydrolysing)